MTIAHKILTGAAALTMAASFASIAKADRFIDPWTLPPAQRDFALRGPLDQYDYTGFPARSGCQYSRIQLPSDQGLRWFVDEDCSQNYNR